MKLKIALAVVALLLIGGGFAFNHQLKEWGNPPISDVWAAVRAPDYRPAPTITIDRTPEKVARGKYLVEHVAACFQCHGEKDWTKYGGPVKQEGRGVGTVCFDPWSCPRNITPAKVGIGGWTDGEILRALREGVDKDNRMLYPNMPYTEFRELSDDDATAIVAYLRTLPAVEKPVNPEPVPFGIKTMLVPFFPRPLTGPVAAVDPHDKVAYGRYLTRAAGCFRCHTPQDDTGHYMEDKAMSGGIRFDEVYGASVSANLTPDETTGIGKMSEEDFISRFHAYREMPDTVPPVKGMMSPMPWRELAGMTSEDLSAIFAYLRSVKPVQNEVQRFPDLAAAAPTTDTAPKE